MAAFSLETPFQALDVFALAVLAIALCITTWRISVHKKYDLRVFVLVNVVLLMVQSGILLIAAKIFAEPLEVSQPVFYSLLSITQMPCQVASFTAYLHILWSRYRGCFPMSSIKFWIINGFNVSCLTLSPYQDSSLRFLKCIST
jgi:hypothetical protein